MKKNIMIETVISYKFRAQNATLPIGDVLAPYGSAWAVASNPLARLCTASSCAINDTAVSFAGNLFPSLLPLAGFRKHAASSMVPTMLGRYASNNAGFATQSDVCAGYEGSVDSEHVPNGSYRIRWTDKTGAYIAGAGYQDEAGLTVTTNPVGAPTSCAASQGVGAWCYFSLYVTEGLFLPPFAPTLDDAADQGCFGITSLNITLMMGKDPGTARSVNFNSIANGTVFSGLGFGATAFNDAATFANLTYLTPPLSAPLPALCIAAMPMFANGTSTSAATFPPVDSTGNLTGVPVTLSSIQLDSVPQLIVFVATQTPPFAVTDTTDRRMSITRASIQFANVSSLCSSMSQQQLYQASRENGVDLDWPAWSGVICRGGGYVAGVGSVLALRPGKDFPLPDLLVPGSAATLTLAGELSVANQDTVSFDGCSILTICVYNSFLTISRSGEARGPMRVQITEKEVLDVARDSGAYSGSLDYKMFGGSLFSGAQKLIADHGASALAVGKAAIGVGKAMHGGVRSAVSGAGAGVDIASRLM